MNASLTSSIRNQASFWKKITEYLILGSTTLVSFSLVVSTLYLWALYGAGKVIS